MTPSQFKQIRLNLGLTQSKLDKGLRLSRGTVWRYENGKCAIPAFVQKVMERVRGCAK